ncbi:MAG: AsmA-like C-terminal region-containing protein [Flavobacteriales bacterium]
MKFWLRLFKRLILFVLILMTSISLVLFIFEDRIISKVVAGVNTYLKVPVQVQQIELHFWRTFPNISIAFNHLQVADPFQKTDTLLSAEQICLRFNPIDLLYGEYNVGQITAFNGQVHIKYNRNGNINCDIFKQHAAQESSAFDLTLKDLFLEQFELSYYDAQTAQALHAHVEQTTLSGNFSAVKTKLIASGTWQLKQIKKGKVVLLREQPLAFNFSLLVDQKNNTIKLPQAKIELAHLPFLLDADFGPKTSTVDLQTADVSLLQLVKTVSPSNLKQLRRIKAQGEVAFQLHYQTSAGQPKPQINAYFGIQNGSLTEPQFGTAISALRCSGTYKNLPIDELQIGQFSFKSKGAEFSGHLQLSDFSTPRLIFATKGRIPLALAQLIYPQDAFTSINGNAELELNGAFYQNKSSQWQTKSLKGSAHIAATQLKLNTLQKPFTAINCALQFDDAALQVQKCSAQIGTSSFEIKASCPDLFHSVQVAGPKEIKGNLQATNLVLADFQTTTSSAKADWILPQQFKLKLPFQVTALRKEHNEWQSASGVLELAQHIVLVNDLEFSHAGGSWNGKLRLEEVQPEKFAISTTGKVRHLDIREWFAQWQNFGQDVLLAEQIKGKGALEFEAKAQYGFTSGLDENSLKARMHCRIENGRLIQAPILQELASSLTFGKGRAILGAKNQAALCHKLQDVAFETLENTFLLENRVVQFAKMHIASSALDIDLVGKHSFEQQIDYAVGLRLRDLLVQQTQTEFGEILDDGTGIRICARICGSLDTPEIKWDKTGQLDGAKLKLEKSNQESKEMLKAAFGIYRKNPTVDVYQEPNAPHESIQLHFNDKQPTDRTNPKIPSVKEKNKKLQQKLEQWKLDQEKNQEKEVSVRVVGSG